MNTAFAMQLRREFWEHRSLWIAPLVWVSILLVMSAWVIFVVIPQHGEHELLSAADPQALAQLSEHDRREIEKAMAYPAERKESVVAFSYLAINSMISGFMCIVVFFYLIDCLYAERRDRSILFWKSLPISDTQVVLSKLTTAMVVVPLGVLLLATVTQLVLFLMFWMKFAGTVVGAVIPDWSILSWLKSQVVALALTLGGVIWYAPIAGYLLLVSSWARRNVFLWAVLPPAALVALEGFFLHSTHVLEFIGWRFSGYIKVMHVNPAIFNTGTSDDELPRINDVFSAFDLSGIFMSAEAWIGLVAAAALIYVTIRLRSYRDDS